jgi:TolB-like protein
MAIFDELRRRNVFRVAAAYLVISWLLMQVADTLAPALHLPESVNSAVLFFLILGFPLALFFAWAFELTPEGLKREKDVEREHSITRLTGRKLDRFINICLAAALGYFAYDRFVSPAPGRGETSESSPHDIVASKAPRQSIAVLPFVNMSGDPDNEYFSDGLSEEILNLLARIPDLKVIGRTSSFAFKGKNEDLRAIGEALDVVTVLEGLVRKSGDRVRITAQLIDVADGSHIWSDTYDRTMVDIFAIQDDVAGAIVETLQLHISSSPSRGRPTDNTEAYALFLKARSQMNAYQTLAARDTLQAAIALDPQFAEAFELLAVCFWNLAGAAVKSGEGQQLTFEAAGRALALDPDLAMARALYKSADIQNYSWLGEIVAVERVIREQPGNVDALDILAYDLLEAGYLEEAERIAARFVELDPLSIAANWRYQDALRGLGRHEEADEQLQNIDALAPRQVDWIFGVRRLLKGQDDEAAAYFESALEQQEIPDTSWVRGLLKGARDPATGQSWLDQRIPEIVASQPEDRQFDLWRVLVSYYLLFGYVDRYFEIIQSLDLTSSTWTDADFLVYVGTLNRNLGFTAHPKYVEVAESIGLFELWDQRGAPDFCENIDGTWVCD